MQQSLLIKTNKKLLKLTLVIIMFSVVCAMFVPANILMLILSSWKIQLLLLLSLMLCLNSQKETLYALVIGSFYISPLASYVYFNLANGPILLGLSLSVMLITICVNYFTINQDYPLETRTKTSALSQLGKGSLISLCIIGVVGVICFSILNIIPLTTFLYTASLSWFAIQMICLREVNILFQGNALVKGIGQASIASMSLFADPLNIFWQDNNFTNNVVTRLIWLIWSVIIQVLEIPASIFYYLRYKWYIYSVHYSGIDSVPEAVKRDHADIYYNDVQQDSWALRSVPEKLRTKEICKIAVTQNGLALIHVPATLRDEKIYEAAVQQNGLALQYVPEGLRKKEICEMAVQQNSSALEYVPEAVKRVCPEICNIAVRQNGSALQYVPEDLKTKEICEMAVKQNGWALASVPEWLRKKEICEMAVKQNGFALRSVPEAVKLVCPEICNIAVRQNGWALRSVPEAVKRACPEICNIAVQQNGLALQYVPEGLRKKEICNIAVNQDVRALEYVPEHLKTEIQIIKTRTLAFPCTRTVFGKRFFLSAAVPMPALEEKLDENISYQHSLRQP